jgi:LPS-assembly protein
MTRRLHILRLPRSWVLGLCALLVTVLGMQSARAQTADAALLVADQVLITQDGRLKATGNVEAFYEGTRVFTDEIIYDQNKDELIVPGPIRLRQENGDILLADSADLDSKLENGLMRGARYVLNQEMQILSAQTDRVDGRYTVLRKVISTSCQICNSGIPIWQIRAQRAVHDTEEKQIYFQNAQFRMFGVPLLYTPVLRIPDPSLKRTTGFLMPLFVSNSSLGVGLKMPYFITLGEHADITLTPFLTPQTRTVELRFRRQFRRGYIELNGAASQDTLRPGELRNYVTGFGAFSLPRDYVLSFDVETASDAGYRGLYGYSGRDRLGSGVKLTRTKRDTFFQAEIMNFETLRDNESNDTQPTVIGNLTYERRFHPKALGGELRMAVSGHGHQRTAKTDVTGRDMTRLSFDAIWHRDWTLARGLRFGLKGGFGLDSYTVAQDAANAGNTITATPMLAATLRYPFKATGADGARYLIEPIAQAGWAGGKPSNLPNDESVSAEFDEGNLLALSRFPVKERRETGPISAIGLRWTRNHDTSWSAGLTIGQVIRGQIDPTFTKSSGLQNLTSDTLIAGQYSTASGLSLQARALINAAFDPIKTEARMGFSRGKFGVSGNYVQLKADAAELRTSPIAEWSLNSTYKISRHWNVRANFQYDILADRASKTGAGFAYENECISVGLGANRSFARSSALVPTTTYELAVSVRGFSTGGSGKAARRNCIK